jgi:hypothetical protein
MSEEISDMPKQRISQATLSAIIRRRKRIADLQGELEELESALTADLKEGFEVAPGILTAYIKEWERRNVSWKDVVIRQLGQPYADRVLAATKPDPQSKLVVESV